MSKFLIYKSSAGSGKTSTLIEVFLKLSLATNDARHFKKILAITFTNKAAAEMKDRLIEELNNLSNLTPDYSGDNYVVNNLLKALDIDVQTISNRASNMFKILLHDYNDLSIGTIDQFNHRLIRSFSRDLRLKSDFEVELDQKNLFHEPVERLIERVGRDEYITEHLLGYMSLKLDDEKRVDIAKDLEKMQKLILDESGLEAITELKSREDIDFKVVRNDLNQKRKTARDAIRQKGQEGLDFLSTNGLSIDDFSRKASGYGGYFQKMTLYPEKDINVNATVAKALEGEFLTKTAPADTRSLVDGISGQLIANLSESIAVFEENHRAYSLTNGLMWQIDLIAVLEELSNCLDEICEERNILPISKFNKLISEALRKEPVAYLYEHYGMRFDHILIDEYQDTSELQWFNILPLIEESLAKGKTSMVVGDAKQSIYRWRGGKAEQLIALPLLINPPEDLRLVAAETLQRTHQVENLNTNYRSRANVVAFNNKLFTQLGKNLTIPESLYESEYEEKNVSQEKNERLTDGYIRIDYLGKKPEKDTKWDVLLENIERFREKGYAYADMAIIVRSTAKEGRLILDRLQEAEIPVSTANSFEIDKDIEVRLILALLRLSYDSENAVAKIAVMRSMQGIFNIPFEPHNFTDYGKIDLNRFLKAHNKPVFRSSKNAEGIYELTERLIATYLPDSKNSFLNALLNVIVGRVGLNGTCRGFFDWWDTKDEKPSVPGSEGSDAIQLTTIHKSKGLQYKVVFAPDLDWRFRAIYNNLKWFDLRNHPISPLPFAPLPVSGKLKDMGLETEWNRDEEETNFDNLNMVYVALTRAVDALCISYGTSGKGNIGEALHAAIDQIQESELSKMDAYQFTDNEDAGSVLEIGEIPAYQKPEVEEKEGKPIPWTSPDNEPWFTKVLTAPQIQDPERIRGVRFHNLVSVSKTAAQAQSKLGRWMAGGEISISEHDELLEMTESLFGDKRFKGLIETSKAHAERELFFENSILRPDLVLENDKNTILIDFKTGDEDEKYEKQVSRYGLALQQISTKPVQAFIVYISPVRWVEVEISAPQQRTLFD